SERVYKAFLLGMLSIALNGYEVESEIESGYGRLDVVVYPKEKRYGSYAAIFEVKQINKEGKLEEYARKAVEQIRERAYYEKMVKKGFKVIGFGIAFCGKKAELVWEHLRR
ncbi:MAG: PD-(D/E)XK nuclease domain-containing protein, partial [Thermotogae bacterium]|nr:PD-(D/E)XK nuclease domain-containing protein [Thermotogota bacterium]